MDDPVVEAQPVKEPSRSVRAHLKLGSVVQNIVADQPFARAQPGSDDQRVAFKNLIERFRRRLGRCAVAPNRTALPRRIAHDQRSCNRLDKKHRPSIIGPWIGTPILARRDRHGWRVHERFDKSRVAIRRCSVYCPFGIDTAEISMAAREIIGHIGMVQKYCNEIIGTVFKIGNNLGLPPKALKATLEGLEEEIEEETGIPVRLPIDEEGADILLVTPSADFFASPHMEGLIGFGAPADCAWRALFGASGRRYGSRRGRKRQLRERLGQPRQEAFLACRPRALHPRIFPAHRRRGPPVRPSR